MQRKATKNTRGVNADERRFMGWVKEHSCIVCGNPPPSIVHHCEGSTFRHNKVLCGMWFILPLCQTCDDVVTKSGKPAFRHYANATQAALWFDLTEKSPMQPPVDVCDAIADWGR